MASNLEAMASNLLAMASNLLYNCDGLQPRSNGLQPNSDGLLSYSAKDSMFCYPHSALLSCDSHLAEAAQSASGGIEGLLNTATR